MIIRNVTEKDLPDVVDIQIAGWRTAYRSIIDDEILDTINREERLARRRKDWRDTGFIVAEKDGEVVGFCRYIDNNSYSSDYDVDCELMAIYLRPDVKRQGIGCKLFNYVADEFRRQGKKKMILWCLKDNQASRRFYEAMGGTLGGEKTFETGGKSFPEIAYLYDL